MSNKESSLHHDEMSDKVEAQSPVGYVSANDEDPDVALAVLAAFTHEEPITEKEERALLFKIDLVLIPLTWMIYGLSYVDKAIISIAALFGFVTDLKLFRVISTHPTKLDTGRYTNVSFIFYTGLIVGSVFWAFVGQRFKLRLVITGVLLTWGVTATCTAALQNYHGALVQRFFLGCVEGGIAPCLLLLTGMWYKKSEQAMRVGIWFSSAGSFTVWAYPICYALLHIKSHLAAWRIMHLFWGCFTIVFGILLALFLPGSPVEARFLTPRHRYVAIERLRSDQGSVENKHFKSAQAIEALLDPKLWLLCVIAFTVSTANGAVSSFSSLVIQTIMKSSAFKTVLLLIPLGVCSFTFVLACCYAAQRIPNSRCFIALFAMCLVLVCSSLLWKLPQTNAPGLLASVYLMGTFPTSYIMVLSFTSSNVQGHTKKTAAAAAVTMFAAVGNVAGPLFFQKRDSPRYIKGFTAITICYAIAIVAMTTYRFVVVRENRRRDALGEQAHVDHAFHDLTDKENLSFRYEY